MKLGNFNGMPYIGDHLLVDKMQSDLNHSFQFPPPKKKNNLEIPHYMKLYGCKCCEYAIMGPLDKVALHKERDKQLNSWVQFHRAA